MKRITTGLLAFLFLLTGACSGGSTGTEETQNTDTPAVDSASQVIDKATEGISEEADEISSEVEDIVKDLEN